MEHGNTALVPVTVVGNELQAELVCGMLRSEGVACMHRITNLGFGSGGEMPLSGGGPREVLVRAEEEQRARELLTQVAE